jgi:poly-gamma-glutamate synthesis protein (capsule biosynthesis protein)
LFTGAIVPGRCVQAAIEQRGQADYLYKGVRELIGEADLAVGTLNAALSDYPPSTGCVETFVLVGGSINADAMAGAGFDLLSVATNHIKNCGLTACGERAFLDTLENLNRVGILPVGAGLNLAQALQPVIVTSNGIRFGFVSLGEIEARAFAGESQPGIAPLNDENLMAAITAAREQADVVVVLPHWGSDYSFTPNYRQRHFARIAQQAGADLVVGNHSHVIQGMQEIEGMPVFYSLGSFVFDQTWLLEGESEPVLQQGLMLRVTFEGTEVLSSEVIPVHIADDKSGQVQIADPVEAAKILERFQSISEALE